MTRHDSITGRPAAPWSATARRGAPFLALVLLTLAPACTAFGDGDRDAGLGTFATDTAVVARVVDNVEACVVDAVCYLELAFADTVVRATYGPGLRPAPPCEISRAASDAAFAVSPGDRMEVVVYPCPGEGLYLRSLAPAPPRDPGRP